MAKLQKIFVNPVSLRNFFLILTISFSMTSCAFSSSASASCPKDSTGDDCNSSPDSPPADLTSDLQSGTSIITWIRDSFSTPPLGDIVSVESNSDDLSTSFAEDSSNVVQESDSESSSQEGEVEAVSKSGLSDSKQSSDSHGNIISVESKSDDLSTSFSEDSSNVVQENDFDSYQDEVEAVPKSGLSDSKPSSDSVSSEMGEIDSLLTSFAEDSSNVVQESDSESSQGGEIEAMSKSGLSDSKPSSDSLGDIISVESKSDDLSTSFAEDSSNVVQESYSDASQDGDVEAVSNSDLSDSKPSSDSVSSEVDETDNLPTEKLSDIVTLDDPAAFYPDERNVLAGDVSATRPRRDTTDSEDDIFYKLIDKVANQYKPRDSSFFRKDEMPNFANKVSSDIQIPNESVVSKQDVLDMYNEPKEISESQSEISKDDKMDISIEKSSITHLIHDSAIYQQDGMENLLPEESPDSTISNNSELFQQGLTNLSTQESSDISESNHSLVFHQNEMNNLSNEYLDSQVLEQLDKVDNLPTEKSSVLHITSDTVTFPEILSTEALSDIPESNVSAVLQHEISESTSPQASSAGLMSNDPDTSRTDENDYLTEDLLITPPQTTSATISSSDDPFYSSVSKLANVPDSTDSTIHQENDIENLSTEKLFNVQSSDTVSTTQDVSATLPQTDSPDFSSSETDDTSSLSLKFSFSISVSDSNTEEDLETSTHSPPLPFVRQDRSEDVLSEKCKKVKDLPIAEKLQDPCKYVTTKGINKEDIIEDREQVVTQVYHLFLDQVEVLKCSLATMMRENILNECPKLGLPLLEKVPTAEDLKNLQPDHVIYLYYSSLLNHSAHVHFLVHQMEKYDYTCIKSYRQDPLIPTTQLSKKLPQVLCFLKLLLLSGHDHLYEDTHFTPLSVRESVLCRPSGCSGRHLQLCQVVMSLDKVLTGLVHYVEGNVVAEGLNLPLRPGIADRCKVTP